MCVLSVLAVVVLVLTFNLCKLLDGFCMDKVSDEQANPELSLLHFRFPQVQQGPVS